MEQELHIKNLGSCIIYNFKLPFCIKKQECKTVFLLKKYKDMKNYNPVISFAVKTWGISKTLSGVVLDDV